MARKQLSITELINKELADLSRKMADGRPYTATAPKIDGWELLSGMDMDQNLWTDGDSLGFGLYLLFGHRKESLLSVVMDALADCLRHKEVKKRKSGLVDQIAGQYIGWRMGLLKQVEQLYGRLGREAAGKIIQEAREILDSAAEMGT